MKQLKVSVVVPIYNPGKYFRPLLESLKSQTLAEIEFICVLDAVTDGSDMVLEEYARNDSRFKVIANEHNMHVGATRNIGMAAATGKYVGFADDDDECEPTMWETMFEEAEKSGADFLISRPTYGTLDGKYLYHDIKPDITPEEIQKDLVEKGGYAYSMSRFGYVHNCLYNRSFLQKHGLSFVDTKLAAPEDSLFNLNVALLTDKICYYPKTLYVHFFRVEATSSSKGGGKQYFAPAKVLAGLEQFCLLGQAARSRGMKVEIRAMKTLLDISLPRKAEVARIAPGVVRLLRGKNRRLLACAVRMSFCKDAYGKRKTWKQKLIHTYIHTGPYVGYLKNKKQPL